MIKKISVESWPSELSYFEGTVTSDDVIIGEVEETSSNDETRNGGIFLSARRSIRINPEIDELIGLNAERTYNNTQLGHIVQRVFVVTDNPSARAFKLLETRYKKEFEQKLGDTKVQEDVKHIVDAANMIINRSKDNVARLIAQNVQNFRFDRQDEIDKLDESADKLRAEISQFEKRRREIIAEEVHEWMNDEELPDDIQEQIMEEGCFDRYRRKLV